MSGRLTDGRSGQWQALKLFCQRYEIEREVRGLAAPERKTIGQDKTKLIADALHQWLAQQGQQVPDGSATAKAIDHGLKRCPALVASLTTGICRSTTIGSRIRSSRLRSQDRACWSPAACARANALQRW